MKVSRTNHLDENRNEKEVPPTPKKEIFTSRKHSMDYFTVDGVTLRTGYKNKRDWYLLPIREMLDNDADFLWKYYRGADNASITVSVTMDDELFRVTVRNSNEKNIPVFSDLGTIFDYDMRYGSKQDVHIISRGMLGDAMKQILSLGYVLLHTSDDGTAFTDKQLEHPLIIRHNKKEWKIYLHINNMNIQGVTLPWFGILLGRPSSLKTAGIQALSDTPGTFFTDIFTPKAFVSNNTAVSKDRLKDIDMLPKIKNKLFLVSELSSMFTKKDEEVGYESV